jgi:YaiO family outer membrane protein
MALRYFVKILFITLSVTYIEPLLAQNDVPVTLPTGRKDTILYQKSGAMDIKDSVSGIAGSNRAYQQKLHIEAGGGYEYLSNGFVPWSLWYIQTSWNPLSNTSFYGHIQAQNRFSLFDVNMIIGGIYPIQKNLITTVEVSASPSSLVVPIFSLYGQAQLLVGNGFNVGAGYKYSRYQPTAIQTVIPSIEWYIGNFRLAYTLYSAFIAESAGILSHLGQLSYYIDDNSAITFAANTGQEGALIAPRVIKIFEVIGGTVSGRQMIVPRLTFVYELLWQRQGSLFERWGGRVGVRYQLP